MSKIYLLTFLVLFVLGTAFQLSADPVIDLNVPPGLSDQHCYSCWIVRKDDNPQKVTPQKITPYLRCVCSDMEKGHEVDLETTLPLPCGGKIVNKLGKLVCQ